METENCYIEGQETQLLRDLENFTGTENYYKSDFGKLNYTDGIQYLREKINCYWLFNIVESVQYIQEIQENKEFIVWLIEVKKDKSFVVSAWNDTPYKSELLYKQEGKYTDFILKDFEFYQEGNVILLKSEH